MQKEIKSFECLESELLEKLILRGYTSTTITGYRYLCNSVISWFKENGFSQYTEQGANQFLQEYVDNHGKNEYYRNLRTVVFRLNDVACDTWKEVHSDKGKHFDISEEYNILCNCYCNFAKESGLASGSIRNKRYAVSWFLSELEAIGCCSIRQLVPSNVSTACLRITDHNMWTEIRGFLKYLFSSGSTDLDYSTLVPHFRKPYVIPSVYSLEEIKMIESVVDTTTALGKRDYAMILFASRMGLRSGDIVKLNLKDVNCNQCEINIIQEKTGNLLHLPILQEVRLAVNDYLSVRPNVKCDKLFLNLKAPYLAVTTSTLRNALRKYISTAGIIPKHRKCGPHALRSSMASSMVNAKISYEVVRKVLGHSSKNAIKHYARIDIENLRRYSLQPPPPTGEFRKFLYGGGVREDAR